MKSRTKKGTKEENSSIKVNPFLAGVSKVKDLIEELEESFRESSNVGNNLILRCVLLRAENQNLIHKIDKKNRNLSTTLYSRQWMLSVKSQEKLKPLEYTSWRKNSSGTSVNRSVTHRSPDEIDILHKTIGDLQKKIREKDKKIENLYQKYLDLKTNKNKMEGEFKNKISDLEKQLELCYDTLSAFHKEVELLTSSCLSQTKSTYEALFLQEQSRCRKLMYEKIKLHHEIKRLEEVIRRQSTELESDNEGWNVVKTSLDKSSSEPYMRHF